MNGYSADEQYGRKWRKNECMEIYAVKQSSNGSLDRRCEGEKAEAAR